MESINVTSLDGARLAAARILWRRAQDRAWIPRDRPSPPLDWRAGFAWHPIGELDTLDLSEQWLCEHCVTALSCGNYKVAFRAYSGAMQALGRLESEGIDTGFYSEPLRLARERLELLLEGIPS